MKSDTCCFTGHRNQKLPWRFNEQDMRCLTIKEIATTYIKEAILKGKTHFISGMAIGFDMICAEIVNKLKKEYPYITLECALPCREQEKLWHKQEQERYHRIIEKADKVRCIHNHYVNGCMQERNRYMINNSSLVIALFNGKSGGTKQTIEYAKEQGLEVHIISL